MKNTIKINKKKLVDLIIAAKDDFSNIEYAIESKSPLEIETGSQEGVHDLLDVILAYTWWDVSDNDPFRDGALDSLLSDAEDTKKRRLVTKILATAVIEGIIVVKRNGEVANFDPQNLGELGHDRIVFV